MKKKRIMYLATVFLFVSIGFALEFYANNDVNNIISLDQKEKEEFLKLNDDGDNDGDYSNQNLDFSFLEGKSINTKYKVDFYSSGHNESEFHPYRWGQFGYFVVDNQITFCIDPLTTFTNEAIEVNPNSSTWNEFSTTEKNNISIMASLGIKNYEQTNNKEFLYATQLLIWEFGDDRYNLENNTNLQNEINQLREEFANYFKIPSFSSKNQNEKKHTLKYNESTKRYEILLTDSNGVLDKKHSKIFNTNSGDFKFHDGSGSNTLLVTTQNPTAKLNNYKLNYKGNSKSQSVRIFSSPQDLFTGPTIEVNSYFSLDVLPATGDLKVEKDIINNTEFSVAHSCEEFQVILNPGNLKKTLTQEGDKCVTSYNDLMPGNYTITEVNNSKTHSVVVGNDSEQVESNVVKIMNIKNEVSYSNIEIIKKGNTNLLYPLKNNVNLAGAEYSIYDSDDLLVEKLITDSNGYAKSKNLPLGTYFIKETKAPNGYVIDNNKYQFELKEHQKILKKEFVNKAIVGEAELIKVGETLENNNDTIIRLMNAEFSVYQNKQFVKKVLSDKNGYVNTGELVYGNYTICETKPPYGYLPSDYCEDFSIKTNGEVVKLKGDIQGQVSNYPLYGRVSLYKIGEDINSNEIVNLKDAYFDIIDLDTNKVVQTLVTDINGFASSEKLKAGKYRIIETKAPEGYVNDGFSQEFEIKSDGEMLVLNNNNPINNNVIKSIFTLQKSGETLDNFSSELLDLSGVEFKLFKDDNANKKYDEKDQYLTTYLTDEHGVINSEPLKYGDYVLVETNTVPGYHLENQEFAFSVVNDGEIIKINQGIPVINKAVKGDLEILKQGSSHEEIVNLENVHFEVYQDVDKNMVLDEQDLFIEEIITDSRGYAGIEDLKYGGYFLKETSTNEGYILDGEAIYFEIDYMDKKIEYQLDNIKIENYFKLKKHDQYEKDLSGAEFTVYKEDEDGDQKLVIGDEVKNVVEIEKYVSNNKGEITSSFLPEGIYYIKETKAPEGYEINPKIEIFQVNEQSMDEEFYYDYQDELIENILEIDKRDKETNKLLSGAEIKVYDEKNNVIDEFVSDQTTHKIKLRYGNYKVCEKSPPDGYEIDEKCQKITVSDDDVVQHINIFNSKIKENIIVRTGIKLIVLPFVILILSMTVLLYVRR